MSLDRTGNEMLGLIGLIFAGLAVVGVVITIILLQCNKGKQPTVINAILAENESSENGRSYRLQFQLKDGTSLELKVRITTYGDPNESDVCSNFAEEKYCQTLPLNQWGQLVYQGKQFLSFKTNNM